MTSGGGKEFGLQALVLDRRAAMVDYPINCILAIYCCAAYGAISSNLAYGLYVRSDNGRRAYRLMPVIHFLR